MGWPQITVLVLLAMGVGASLVKHGEPKGNWSVWGSLFAAGVDVWLLHAGGFFP